MYSSSHYLRAIIAAILSVQMILPPQWFGNKARASQEEDFVSMTHRFARERAQTLLNEILVEAMFQAIRSQVRPGENGIEQAMRRLTEQIGVQLQRAETMTIRPDEVALLTGQELSKMSIDFTNLMVQLRANRSSLRDYRVEAANAQAMVRNMAEGFMANLQGYCRDGVTISPYSQILPAVKPLIPVFSINFEATVQGQPDGSSQGGSAVSIGSTPEEQAMWVGLYAVNAVIAGKLITGQWILTGSAMAAQTAATSAAILGAAFAATAVIALIVIAVSYLKAQEESRKMVERQREMFENRASAEDGRRYFQEYCRQTEALFGDLSKDLDAVANGDQTILGWIEAQGAEQEAFINRYVTIFQAYRAKREQLTKDLPPQLSDEQRSTLFKQLSESEEGKKFQEISNELTSGKMAQVIRYLMLRSFRDVKTMTDRVQSYASQNLQNIDLRQLRAREQELRELAIFQNTREIEIQTQSSWQDLLKESREVAGLYAELDGLILAKARLIFESSVNSDIRAQWQEIETKMTTWYTRLQTVRGTHPDNTLLQKLERDFNYLRRVGQL